LIFRDVPQIRPNSLDPVMDKVKEIVNQVIVRGDDALIELTSKFDKVKLINLNATIDELREASDNLSEDVKISIDRIWDQLKNFHESVKPPNIGGGRDGIYFGIIWRAIEKVGIYVPGGLKSYPSTLMMAGIPAKVAGVSEIYVCSPSRNGKVDPALAYVALKLGVKSMYKVGGAQAIAAMAFGTKTVTKVDKIVGPGNLFVQAAKFLVSDKVGIDGIEGPTELVIIADDSAKPELIVKDLMAQGEHGPSTFLVFISWNDSLLEKVNGILESLSKGKSSDMNFYLVKAKDQADAVDIANRISPEHLSLYVRNPRELLSLVRNTGAVSMGYTPPAIIDYAAGPNHILPTNGWSRFRGGVTVYDFLKPIMYADAMSPSKDLVRASITLAKYEGFQIHGESIGERYE